MPQKSEQSEQSEQSGQDLFSKLTGRGEDMIGRINDLNINIPVGQKVMDTANQLKERLDEMQRRMRGLDALERRVDALEKKVDELSRAGGGSRKASTAKTTAAKPKPKAST